MSRALSEPLRIAVLMTSHNRKALTLTALESLLVPRLDAVEFDVFLTDDGSSDGTSEAVRSEFPKVHLLSGDGSLYWAGAMAVADAEATNGNYDYYLWLNDDVKLDPDALPSMLAVHSVAPGCIVVGAMRDSIKGEISYGGRRRTDWHPLRYAPLVESSNLEFMDTFEGNCVLVPASVRKLVGPIDGAFPHAYADNDYGLRATALGVPIVQPAGTLGVCDPNPHALQADSLLKAWRLLQSPKGLNWRAQMRFFRRHGGRLWPFVLIAGQAKSTLRIRIRGWQSSPRRLRAPNRDA